MASWQVNQARNHWSEVLDQAESEGPQIITHHGKERAVVLSMEAYRSLGKTDDKPDFITYLLSIPKLAEGEEEEWEAAMKRNDAPNDREIDL